MTRSSISCLLLPSRPRDSGRVSHARLNSTITCSARNSLARASRQRARSARRSERSAEGCRSWPWSAERTAVVARSESTDTVPALTALSGWTCSIGLPRSLESNRRRASALRDLMLCRGTAQYKSFLGNLPLRPPLRRTCYGRRTGLRNIESGFVAATSAFRCCRPRIMP